MMRTSVGRTNPDVERAVKNLLTEDSNFDRHENRSQHREHLVRPLMVQLREPEQSVAGFSRNISAAGIGIISDQQIADGSTAVIEVTCQKGPDQKFLAECRWSKSYGDDWFISGWQFVSMKR